VSVSRRPSPPLTVLPPQAALAERVSGPLKIYVLNVGQGDAILIVCPRGTHRMLIDAGARAYPKSLQAFKDQLTTLMGSTRKSTWSLPRTRTMITSRAFPGS
jgi:hypothetical protein